MREKLSKDYPRQNGWGTVVVTVVVYIVLNGSLFAQHHNKHDERALKEDPAQATEPIAPVLEGLGDHHHEITTSSEKAQQFFDQGLKLTYGFNHQEALRSFKEAARLDPDCAMAYWGWALVLGPNLNLPMKPEVVPNAYAAIRMALARKDKVSEKERDFIDALAARYAKDPDADRGPLDAAYAEAMKKLHQKYPEDTDAATLYAAALMNLSPWNYWTKDGRPRPNTPYILVTLEEVMERDPQHEGALHYYIHAVEAVDPKRGEKAADTLRDLAPGAGHLTHMPSHIYMRRGRYEESYEANTLAAKADEGYITQCRAQGIYPLNYYPHNVHFLAWAAIMQGRSADALVAARKLASKVPENLEGNSWGLFQTFLSMPLYTLVRFGKWKEVLEEPKPPKDARLWTGMWHYARGLAYAHTAQDKKARKELTALQKIQSDPKSSGDPIGLSTVETLLTIATQVLWGEIEAKAARYDQALLHLDRAVRLEDSLLYNEPPDWYYPVRHTLGAVLLEAGYPKEAEVVYWQDLAKNPDNGYSLIGLWQSLKAQNRDKEAKEIADRYWKSWEHADIKLTTSRY